MRTFHFPVSTQAKFQREPRVTYNSNQRGPFSAPQSFARQEYYKPTQNNLCRGYILSSPVRTDSCESKGMKGRAVHQSGCAFAVYVAREIFPSRIQCWGGWLRKAYLCSVGSRPTVGFSCRRSGRSARGKVENHPVFVGITAAVVGRQAWRGSSKPRRTTTA